MKLLVTAFETFGNDTINPSMEVLKYIDEDKIILPVSYKRAKEELISAINKYKPTFILSLGLAQSRKSIAIEERAINKMAASIKDNDGILANCAIMDGDEVLYSNLNIDKLIKKIDDDSVYKSSDCGVYICNEVYYLSLYNLASNALFVHLPPIKGMREDGKDLSYLVEVVKKIIKLLKENKNDLV